MFPILDTNLCILPFQTVESHAFTGLKLVKFIFLPAGVRHLRADAFSGLEMVDKVKLAYLGWDFVFWIFSRFSQIFSQERNWHKNSSTKSWAICKTSIFKSKNDQNTNFSKLSSAKWLFWYKFTSCLQLFIFCPE